MTQEEMDQLYAKMMELANKQNSPEDFFYDNSYALLAHEKLMKLDYAIRNGVGPIPTAWKVDR